MPMTREQAEFAFDNNPTLRRLGRNREQAVQRLMRLSPEEIQSNVPAGAPVGRPVTRQTAISAAMGGPEVKMVTPASPAPMRPGIPIMAPRPEARQLMPADVRQMAAREEAGTPEPAAVEAPAPARAAPAAAKSGYSSPARIAAREAERELAVLNYNKKKMADQRIPVTAEIEMAIDLAERKLFNYQAEANAEESATIDSDRAAILARQEGRIKSREEQVGLDEKDALSNALIKGGLALMNPQRGANFLAALSGGLGQGLETYDAAKAKAIEERARLGAETDALALQRIDALTQARSAAVGAIRRGDEVNERTLRIANLTDEAIVNQATQQARVLKAESEARRAKTQADYEPQVIESEINYRGAMGAAAGARASGTGDDGDGGARPLPPGARAEVEGRLATAYQEQDEAYQNWVAAGKPILGEVKQGDRKWLAASKYEAARGKVNNLLGALNRPKLGAAPVRRAAARPATAPAASTGPKSTKPKGFQGTQAVWDVMTPAEKKLFQ